MHKKLYSHFNHLSRLVVSFIYVSFIHSGHSIECHFFPAVSVILLFSVNSLSHFLKFFGFVITYWPELVANGLIYYLNFTWLSKPLSFPFCILRCTY